MPRRLLIGVAAIVAASLACASQRQFQFQPNTVEAEQLRTMEEHFIDAVASASAENVKDDLDVQGRLALLELVQNLIADHGTANPDKSLLLSAALVLRGGQGQSVFTSDELETVALQVVQDKLAKALDLDASDQALVAALLGKGKVASEQQRRDALAKLLEGRHVEGCQISEPQVSYSARILQHVQAPESPTYAQWLQRIQSAHLVSLDCAEGTHGLLLLTQYKDQQQPQIAAWQFFTEDEWAALKPKLEKAIRQ